MHEEIEAVIHCVAFFYEEGKGGENYRKKNKFRCRVKEGKSISKLREAVCERAGIRETAKSLGLGENVHVQLNRESRKDGRTERYSIETDHQLGLELPSILNGSDKLQLIVYPVKTVFSKKCPTIVIKESSTDKTLTPAQRPSTSQEITGLTEEDKTKLNEELAKRSESKLFKCNTHVQVKPRGENGKIVQWPWKILCGICTKNVQMRYDGDLKGRISYFDRHHYSKCSLGALGKSKTNDSQKKITDMFRSKQSSASGTAGELESGEQAPKAKS